MICTGYLLLLNNFSKRCSSCSNQPRPFITCKSPGPYNGEHTGLNSFPVWSASNLQKPFSLNIFCGHQFIIVSGFHKLYNCLSAPIPPVLCISDRNEIRTNTLMFTPHGSWHMTMQLRNSIGQPGKRVRLPVNDWIDRCRCHKDFSLHPQSGRRNNSFYGRDKYHASHSRLLRAYVW